jgi:very-short-patch-repair endonuclease
MPPLTSLLTALGGIAHISSLRSSGVSDRSIQRLALREGIRRLRNGWYALPDADPELCAAVTAGAQLGCVSALRRWGIWTPPHDAVHLSSSRHAGRAGAPVAPNPGILGTAAPVIHRSGTSMRDLHRPQPVLDALLDVLECQPEDYAFAAVESALRLGLVDHRHLASAVVSSRAAVRRIVLEASTLSESGSESLFLWRIRRAGVFPRQQATIAGFRVDFVVGDRLVVEIDSSAHHGNADRIRDLERDAVLTLLDAHVLRFDYRHVLDDWPLVERAVLAAVERGEHVSSRMRRTTRMSAPAEAPLPVSVPRPVTTSAPQPVT